MTPRTIPLTLLCLLAAGPSGCRNATDRPDPPVAASNSLLECAARDLLGDATPVLRLAEPGMCPGHFDIRPSQVDQLRRCRLLLRLDFQKSLDRKLSGAKEAGLAIAEIRIPGGLCEPDSYLAACRQTAEALIAAGLLDRPAADERLDEITRRMAELASRCQQRAAGLKNEPVVASVHQEAFCRWLGLRPVATFSGADSAGVGQVDAAIREGELAGARLVIANLPEGRRVADALAERLGAKVVVFGNFPALGKGDASFDDLLTANVAALTEAGG